MVMNLQAALVNRLWQLASWPEYRRFEAGLGDLHGEQLSCLARVLGRAESSAYGLRHGLKRGWSYSRFADEVPLITYDDILPYLKLTNGLLSEPVRVWEPTGGSTGGCKWIPWTGGLQQEFRSAVSAWIFDLYRQFPEVRNGRSYWQLTPTADVCPPEWLSGATAGFESDGDYLGALGRVLERAVLVSVDKSPQRFWERTVERLVNTTDLRLISCWSPTFLKLLKSKCEEILGCWTPEEWWPSLGVVSCWTDGPSLPYRAVLAEIFPTVTVQGKGLLSTEAVTTIPFRGHYPLAYRSHFFEFQDDYGGLVPAWGVEKGKTYEVIHSTSGGLLRYRSGDRVRVTGFLGTVPCFEFSNRSGVVDRFGEKLSLDFLQKVIGSCGVEAALGFEDGGYVLFLNPMSESRARELWGRVNEALESIYTYRDCLALEQLGRLRCFVLRSEDCWEFAREDYGRRKLNAVLPVGKWSEVFGGSFL